VIDAQSAARLNLLSPICLRFIRWLLPIIAGYLRGGLVQFKLGAHPHFFHMAESILFSGWLASLTLIVSVSLAVYWVVGHRSSKRKRNSPLPKLSKPGQQDRKAEESRNRKVKAEAEAAEDPATGLQSGDREEETH
jgi:hypothetical protein